MLIGVITIYVMCITLHIMMLPGEILSDYAKYVNFDHMIPKPIKKLMTCAPCISFWVTAFFVVAYQDWENAFIPFAMFIAVYLTSRYIR